MIEDEDRNANRREREANKAERIEAKKLRLEAARKVDVAAKEKASATKSAAKRAASIESFEKRARKKSSMGKGKDSPIKTDKDTSNGVSGLKNKSKKMTKALEEELKTRRAMIQKSGI